MEEYSHILKEFSHQFDTPACYDLLYLLSQADNTFDIKTLFTLVIDHMIAWGESDMLTNGQNVSSADSYQ